MVEVIHNIKTKRINFNTWIAFITLLVLIGGVILSFFVTSMDAQNNIKKNTENLNVLNVVVNDIKEEQDVNVNRITIIETHYNHIKEQLNRIEGKIGVSK